MYRMDKTVLIQTTEKVVAKVSAHAFDQRTQQKENLIVFCELTEKEQDAKPIVERALAKMGYLYLGIDDVDTTTVPFDTEGMYLFGKECEQKDLRNQ